MLSIIITLNQTKPQPVWEVQKYLLNFYVFILRSGLTLCFLLSPGTESADTPMPQGGCASSISELAGDEVLWKSHRKAFWGFCETLCTQLNPPGKWWVKCLLQEKLLLKAEQGAGEQPGWYYTFPAGAEILKIDPSRPGSWCKGFQQGLDDLGT